MIVPFSEKARRFIRRRPEDDAFLNFLVGAVRSGKTWALLAKFIPLCHYKVAGRRVIVGVSKATIYNNVLSDLFDVVGPKNYSYNQQTGKLRLFNSYWIVIGAKDKGSEKYIRGLTVGLAVVDEATLVPEEFFKMLVSRLSPVGARLYATTNPDTPLHYLKAEYLDNPKRQQYVWQEQFFLEDNLSLTEEKRQMYRDMYSGVFYQRFILGLWVIAEGAIYKDAWHDRVVYPSSQEPLGLRNQGGHKRRYISIDYGTHNPCVFLDWYDDGLTFWLAREYYWDSTKEMRQKTDAEYADDLVQFIGGGRSAEILVDPSAASFKLELQKRNLWVSDARNDVLEGIKKTASALHTGIIKVNSECKNTITQMQTHSWDSKAALRGEEAPIKQNDHCPDAFRYLAASRIDDWRYGKAA